jgi:type IV pilus assembly protein PilC
LEIKIPIIGSLFKKVYISRFSQSASVLLKGGIPVAQAIDIAGQTVGNFIYREVLFKAAEGIRQGETMSTVLERSELFPPLVYQMVAVGESTGRLEEILERISKFYSQEVDDLTSNLVELIQPAMIVIIGVAVGFLFASILQPIYNLAQAF